MTENEPQYGFKKLSEKIYSDELLIQLQSEYIKFLEKFVSDYALFLNLNGMHPSQVDIDKGVELRLQIEKVKKQLQ